MKMENKNDYILYRLEKAYDTFDDVGILAEKNKWNTVVNRLYYSCFYAVIALLIKHDVQTKSHDGARNQFSLNFIKTGIFDKSMGKLFSKLFDYRIKGDYGDFFDYDKEIVEPLIPLTKKFIDQIAGFIKKPQKK